MLKARRRYPTRPLVGAGAVVHRGGNVLLVRRKNPPNEGRWSLPGGLVEVGESTQAAAAREVYEETGLEVSIEGLLDVQTDIHRDRRSRIEYHFVLVDYSAHSSSGSPRINGESSEWGWFGETQLEGLDMSEGTRAVLQTFYTAKMRPRR